MKVYQLVRYSAIIDVNGHYKLDHLVTWPYGLFTTKEGAIKKAAEEAQKPFDHVEDIDTLKCWYGEYDIGTKTWHRFKVDAIEVQE